MSAPRASLGRPPLPLVALAVMAIGFLALPLTGLVARAPWSDLLDGLGSPGVRSALGLSVAASLWATALSATLGLPLAWLLARVEFPGRRVVRALCLLPLVLPPVVGGVSLLMVLGRTGYVGRFLESAFGITLFGTMPAVVIAETFVALPFFVITVEAGLRSMDARFEDAAATLGAGRGHTFRRVTLPLIAPSIGAGAVLAWARALGEFGATIAFAGNAPGATQTVPLAVYVRLQSDVGGAVILSLVLVAVSLGVLIALRDRWVPSA